MCSPAAPSASTCGRRIRACSGIRSRHRPSRLDLTPAQQRGPPCPSAAVVIAARSLQPRRPADRGDAMQLLDLPAQGVSAGLLDARQIHAGRIARRHRRLHLRPARHSSPVLRDMRLCAVRRSHRAGRQRHGGDQPALCEECRSLDGQDHRLRRGEPAVASRPVGARNSHGGGALGQINENLHHLEVLFMFSP